MPGSGPGSDDPGEPPDEDGDSNYEDDQNPSSDGLHHTVKAERLQRIVAEEGRKRDEAGTLNQVVLPICNSADEDETDWEDIRTIIEDAKHAYPSDIFAEVIQSLTNLPLEKRTICLMDHIGPRVFDLDRGRLKIDGDPNAVFSLQQPWTDFQLMRQIHVSDATWADDSTMFTFDKEPCALLDKVRRMMPCVLHDCCRYGLIPNTARGKSALVLALRGAGSRAAALEAFRDDAKTITVTTAGAKEFTVHVEASYLHLGGVLSRDDMTHEARRRASVAKASFDGASKRLLLNRHISLQNRAMLFGGLVTSTYHNLELWTSTETAWPQLQRSYDKLQNKLLSCDIHGMQYYRLTAAEAFHITGQQPLSVKTRLKRIGFLCNMVRHGGPEIWAIIQTEHAWALQVWQDFDWVRQWAGDTLPVLTTETWPVWWRILAALNGAFKMKAKRAAKKYVRAEACRKMQG